MQQPSPPLPSPSPGPAHGVGFPEAARTWARIGLYSFGGPAAQIAVMHRILVQEKRWIGERRFLHALNYCMMLPGPEATQLATYVGWLLHKTRGGIVAGTLFVLPGFLAILALSILYAGFRDWTFVEAVFYGVKPAVLAIVLEAVVRIGKRVLKNPVMVALAAAAFIGIFFFTVPFPLIVLGAALIGFIGGRLGREAFLVLSRDENGENGDEALLDAALGEGVLEHTRPSAGRSIRVAAVWLPLWLGPVVLLVAWLGWDNVFAREAVFFSKAAVVTFGGAYAVLAYVAQAAVETYQWLQPGEMLDGLGMAETTPGPLIQVVQFVGFMGAFREPGALPPMAAGVLASVVVTWVTFVPCFLWIFLGAPYVEALRGMRSLTAALSAVTAAVVGVILNLAVWFSLHTIFEDVEEFRRFGARLLIPDPATADPGAVLIAAIAAIALFRLRWGMMRTLALSVAAGIAWFYLVRG
jgi:chromate transporter